MKAQIQLSRAIGCEFLSRKLTSLAILMAIVAVATLAIALGLTTVNIWWWLLAVPVILSSLLLFAVYVIAALAIKMFRPTLTEMQAKAVKDFVDKLERVAEHIQTPMFMIAFRVIWDIIRPSRRTFIQSATEDSTTLHKDLLALQQKFR